MHHIALISLLVFALSCNLEQENAPKHKSSKNVTLINYNANTLKQRFKPPVNYTRIVAEQNSYAYYLQNIALKDAGSLVNYYNGSTKDSSGIYCAVLKQPISNRDLQQCADAVMRLRGEFLFEQKIYDEIHFNFLSDNKPRYFKDYGDKTYSYKNFLKYMDYVFAFANTRSLHNELIAVDIDSIKIGDVFIQTGNPYGHAITVMDLASNVKGEKIMLLAQSYMPAQETQILINPSNAKQSPWFKLSDADIVTPEWTFKVTDLRRFKNTTSQ